MNHTALLQQQQQRRQYDGNEELAIEKLKIESQQQFFVDIDGYK